MLHQVCVEHLRNGKVTLKRFVPGKHKGAVNNWERSKNLPLSNRPYKSIPGMPVFDTLEQAQEYRRLIGWFITIE